MARELDRLPFEYVISKDNLMKKVWEELSKPQQVVVKSFYGLPLDEQELAIWSVFKDHVIYDDLGYPKEIFPTEYIPQEYRTLVGMLGRRSGKSDRITATICLFEILFGGHMKHVEKGQTVIVPYLSLDLPTAKENLYFIYLMAQKVPALAREILDGSGKNQIRFKNGIIVQPEPPVIKTGRGIAMPIVIMDEVGFWYKTSENANPDVEVQRAVAYSQAQFPNRKQIIISTPYTEEGMLWEYAQKDEGELRRTKTLFIRASTAAMQNPRIDRDFLIAERERDESAFIRESLARFVASIDGMIAPELVKEAQLNAPEKRSRVEVETNGLRPSYVAVMDPAFRHDDFVFTIGHRDSEGHVVQDVLKVWSPDHRNKQVLNPDSILSEIKNEMDRWGISVVYSDQYQLEALQQIALRKKFAIVGVDFTNRSKARIYGSLVKLLEGRKMKLLKDSRIYQQLTQLQKKLGNMGHLQIGAPPGKKDDIATVVALLAHQCLQHYPQVIVERKKKTLFEEGIECIQRKRAEHLRDFSEDGQFLPR